LERCSFAEGQLLRTLAHERSTIVDNFDSGKPFEAAVRDEIANLLPRRYEVTNGTVVDRHGGTAGDCDIVLFNALWFQYANAPASPQAVRRLIPIEGCYALGEVKQRLTARSLDEALEKLVVCHRLERPEVPSNRIVENRELDSCSNQDTVNPLFTFILAGETDASLLQPLMARFVAINCKLPRKDVVQCLCVIGHGSITWLYRDPSPEGEFRRAKFVRSEEGKRLVPGFRPAMSTPALYHLIQALSAHVCDSVLAPEDIATAYGSRDNAIQTPSDPEIAIPPG
jgi:hypothetical protein